MILPFINIEQRLSPTGKESEHSGAIPSNAGSMDVHPRELMGDPVKKDEDKHIESPGVREETGKNSDVSIRLFEDTFELRYLQHKDKLEKQRFVRELLSGGQQ